jgi:dihydrofolate synthase/folylpolyglutamate synthase
VIPDNTWSHLVRGNEIEFGGAREAAEAFVGHRIEADPEVILAGRFEQRETEVRDGAHNPDGVRFLLDRLPAGDWTIVVSILADKNADEMLRELRRAGNRLVATRSSSARALPPDVLADIARRHFAHVEAVDDAREALDRAHELGEPVLVTGSLYLVGDLAQAERAGWRR